MTITIITHFENRTNPTTYLLHHSSFDIISVPQVPSFIRPRSLSRTCELGDVGGSLAVGTNAHQRDRMECQTSPAVDGDVFAHGG
jgi:hypothetical protein